jgi:hypothetical protein
MKITPEWIDMVNIFKVYVQTVEMLIDGKSSHGP